MALLSSESIGASLKNFHNDLVPSFNSKMGRRRRLFARMSTRVDNSGNGDRSSGTGDYLNRSGDGVDQPCGCFSNSLDITGEPTFFSDSRVDSTT
ncbi:hypothetical protein SLA2020_296670 [Shorea laevis]